MPLPPPTSNGRGGAPINVSDHSGLQYSPSALLGRHTSSSKSLGPKDDVVGSDFNAWLAEILCAERASVVNHLKEQVASQLVEHQKELLADISSVTQSPTLRPPLPLGQPLRNPSEGPPPSVLDGAEKPKSLTSGATKNDNTTSPSTMSSVKSKEVQKTADPMQVTTLSSEVSHLTSKLNSKLYPVFHGAMRHHKAETGQEAKETSKRTYVSARIRALANEEDNGPWTLRKFVEAPHFELASIMVILLNTVVIALEMQWKGELLGYEMQAPNYEGSAEGQWPNAGDSFFVTGVIFMSIFVCELALRLVAERWNAWRMPWIWLDAILVIAGVLDLVSIQVIQGVNPTVMRLLRLARLCRLVKLIQHVQGFGSLFLLVRSLQASVGALFWCFLLLLLIQVCMAIILGQLLNGFISDDFEDEESRIEVFMYFGTFGKSMLTMFEITLANWVPSCRLLSNKVSEWYGLVFIFYRCMFCFAVLRVITAVFISETNRVAASDDRVAMNKKREHKRVYLSKLEELFIELDDNLDKVVTWDEFYNMFEDDVLKQFLASLEIDVSDLELLFRMLDDGDGEIRADEFIKGIGKCHGEARSLDLQVMSREIDKVNSKLDLLVPHGTVKG